MAHTSNPSILKAEANGYGGWEDLWKMERRLRGEACSAHVRDLMSSSDLWGNKCVACHHTDTHNTR